MRFQLVCLFAYLVLAPMGAAAWTNEELGKKLFFDKRLSSDGKVSCATCHKPELAFTNGKAVAEGVLRKIGDRNVPTLLNRNGTHGQFWDMRADSLEQQVVQVMANPSEMGNDIEGALRRLNSDAHYAQAFRELFNQPATLDNLALAIAAYERTLKAPESPYDRYVHGDTSALSPEAVTGKNLFFNKFKCASCHKGENFSDEKLNVRCYPFVPNMEAAPSKKFKTPTLRNLVFTAPYMHTGALKTLEDAVDFYTPSIHLDARGKPDPDSPPMFVSREDKKALVAFLKSLSAAQPFVESR